MAWAAGLCVEVIKFQGAKLMIFLAEFPCRRLLSRLIGQGLPKT